MRRTAPRAWSSSSERANRWAKCSAGRPLMRKRMVISEVRVVERKMAARAPPRTSVLAVKSQLEPACPATGARIDYGHSNRDQHAHGQRIAVATDTARGED